MVNVESAIVVHTRTSHALRKLPSPFSRGVQHSSARHVVLLNTGVPGVLSTMVLACIRLFVLAAVLLFVLGAPAQAARMGNALRAVSITPPPSTTDPEYKTKDCPGAIADTASSKMISTSCASERTNTPRAARA